MKNLFRYLFRGGANVSRKVISASSKGLKRVRSSKFTRATGNFVKRNWDTLAILGYYGWTAYSNSKSGLSPEESADMAADAISDEVFKPSVILAISQNISDISAVCAAFATASIIASGSDSCSDEESLVYLSVAGYIKETRGQADTLLFGPDAIGEFLKTSAGFVFPDNDLAKSELSDRLDEMYDVSFEMYEETGDVRFLRSLDFYCYYVNTVYHG